MLVSYRQNGEKWGNMDIVLNQNVEIKNTELKKVTTEIRRASANVIGNTFKISALIARVDRDKLYIEDGFSDVFDYVKQCFGLEKASAYNLIRVGNDFIEEVKKGNIISYETLLEHGSKDYSISQVFKMLPLGIEKAKELTTDGVITSDMSCRQIERIVKENTEGTKARGKSKTEPEPNPDNEPDENESNYITCMIKWEELPDEFCDFLRQRFEFDNFDAIGEIIIN